MKFNILTGCQKNPGGRVNEATITLLIVFACALVLRLYHVQHYDLWFDELSTDNYTFQNLTRTIDPLKVTKGPVFFDRMKSDPHSPLYYTVVYFYSIFFGDGKSLRILSVLFSMLSLGMFYKLARLLFDRRASVYALLIMMLSPFHIWYAQEARAYAMTSFLMLSAVYVYIQALQTNKRFYWICFPVLSTLTLFSGYNSLLLFIATGAALFFKDYRRHAIKWIISMLVIAECLLLMRYVLVAQLLFVKTGFWVQAPSPNALLYTWMFYTLGYSSRIFHYQMALPLFLIAFSYGVRAYYRADKPKTVVLISLLFFPVMATYILSKLSTPIYIHRQLFIYSSFYYLFVAKGLASIRNLKVQMVLVLCIGALMGASLVNYYQGSIIHEGNRPDVMLGVLQKKNYDDLMMKMVDNFEDGDYVAAGDLQSYVITHSYVAKHFEPYNDIPLKMFSLFSCAKALQSFAKHYLMIDQLVDNIDQTACKYLYGFALLSDGKMGAAKIDLKNRGYQRIWLVTSSWIKFPPQELESQIVRKHLSEGHFNSIASAERDGIRIELYKRFERPQLIEESPLMDEGE